MIKRLWIWVLAGAAEVYSPRSAFCADPYKRHIWVSVPPLSYHIKHIKRCWSFCQKFRWQFTAKHILILCMWLCLKWYDMVHGLYCAHRMCRDGNSFIWHQPCNNQTVLYVHHCCGYSKCPIKSCRLAFRITCNKSTVSRLESGEQHYYIIVHESSHHCHPTRKLKLSFDLIH